MITLDFTKDQVENENPTEFKLIWGERGEYVWYSRVGDKFLGEITNQDGYNVGVLQSEIQPLIEALQKLKELMD